MVHGTRFRANGLRVARCGLCAYGAGYKVQGLRSGLGFSGCGLQSPADPPWYKLFVFLLFFASLRLCVRFFVESGVAAFHASAQRLHCGLVFETGNWKLETGAAGRADVKCRWAVVGWKKGTKFTAVGKRRKASGSHFFLLLFFLASPARHREPVLRT
jgi:hypothetical protein